MEMREIPIDKIQPNPLQPREKFDKESIKELANSIKEAGLLQPIIVRPDGNNFEIIAGERRWRAFKILGKKKIPAIEWKVEDDTDALEKSVIENLQREDLTPVERENAITVLWISKKYKSQKKLAEKLGWKQARVSQLLSAKKDRKKLSVSSSIPSVVLRETRGLELGERKKIINQVERGNLQQSKVKERVRAIKQSTSEKTKQAVIEGEIEPDEVEVISDLDEERQERVLKEMRLDPTEDIRDIKGRVTQMEPVEIEHTKMEKGYDKFVNGIGQLKEGMRLIMEGEESGDNPKEIIGQSQVNGMARGIFVLIENVFPRFLMVLDNYEVKIDPRFREYVKKFRGG